MDYNPYGDEFVSQGTPINAAINDNNFFSDIPDSYYSPLMQFTGLKDKNGKEIYEGDILKEDGKDYGLPVSWHEATWTVNNNMLLWAALRWKGHEIIGNKFENPELLEDK